MLDKDSYQVSENAWQKIETGLDVKSDRTYFGFLRIAALVVLSFGMGFYFFNNSTLKNKRQPQSIINVETKPIMVPEVETAIVNTPILSTEIKVSTQKKSVQSNTPFIKNEVITEKTDAIVIQETVKEVTLIASNNNETQTTSRINQKDLHTLKIDLPSTSYSVKIDPDNLLKSVEDEIESERVPTLKEKIFNQIKSSINDRYAVIDNY